MEDLRAYGDIHGIGPEAFERLKGGIPFEQVDYADGVLSLDHEGKFFDVESFLDEVVELMDEEGWGKVDFIDHVDWQMTRYTLKKGGWEAHPIKVNNVMEGMDYK